MANAAESMVEVLRAGGVRRAYTVPGESFLGLLDGIEQCDDIQLISTRHESGASFMGEADAKMTGVPAVVMATRGVGASNLAIGVHAAKQDSTPMVVILGQVESDYLGREGFQEVDLTAFYSPITKLAETAGRGDRLPELVANALRVARSGRPGPVMIAVPADLFEHEVDETATKNAQKAARLSIAPPSITSDAAAHIAVRLAGASRPVVIEGGGARGAREELIALSEKFNLGVYASFRRQDGFPNDHPHFLGHLGLGIPEPCLTALRDADLVLVLGARLSEVTTQSYTLPLPSAEIIQIDIDAASIGGVVPTDIGVVSDSALAVREILKHAPKEPSSRTWSEANAIYRDWNAVKPSILGESEGIDPAQVIGEMSRVLPADTVMANDSGNFSAFLHRHWMYRAAKSQLGPTSGSMGYAVPAAIGGALADPSRTMVAVAGDGGFLMSGQEIETAVRYGVSMTVVVFSNGLYGTIAMHQAGFKQRLAGVDIGRVDLAGYARSLGAQAVRVEALGDFADALTTAIGRDGVNMIEVRSEPDLISPSRRLSGMLE